MISIVTDYRTFGHFWPYVGLAESLGGCEFFQPAEWQKPHLLERGIPYSGTLHEERIVCGFGARRIGWNGPIYLPFIPGEGSCEEPGTKVLASQDFAGYADDNIEFIGFHPRKPLASEMRGHAYVYGVDATVEGLHNFRADGARDYSGELSGAAVCVCHGGLGTISEALSYGVPLVVISRDNRDQRANGERVERLGLGTHIKAENFFGTVRVGDF